MAWRAIFIRELRLRWRGGGWAATAGLFTVAAGLAPLALGRELDVLAQTAPALLWLTACLSLLIGLDGLYEEDLRTGGLALYRLSETPFTLIILLKMVAAWVATCLPLVIISPFLLMTFGVPSPWIGALGFLLGTPALAMLSGALGALCAGMRRGTSLLVFLSLPLFAPALIFGPATLGPTPLAPLLFLAAFSLQAIAVCPFVAGAALKAQMA